MACSTMKITLIIIITKPILVHQTQLHALKQLLCVATEHMWSAHHKLHEPLCQCTHSSLHIYYLYVALTDAEFDSLPIFLPCERVVIDVISCPCLYADYELWS